MKKIAKLLSVSVFALLLVLGLAACGGGQQGGDAPKDEPAADAPAEGAPQYIIATDTTFAPFEYAEADGTYVGIDIDILAAVAADQGFTYELQPLGFDAALQAVQAGQADGVIAGMSITEERKQVFDFSEPYFDSTVCCGAPINGDIKSLDDLAGKKVAVKVGTQSQKWAETLADQYGFTMTVFDTSDVMYQDVLAGNSVACFEDTPVMGFAAIRGDVDIAPIADCGADSEFATPYGFAVAKDKNAELLAKFDAGLKNIKDNGTYQKILDKYMNTGV